MAKIKLIEYKCSNCHKKLSRSKCLIELSSDKETGRFFCSYNCLLEATPLKLKNVRRLRKNENI
jgi:DNA-directed RNA polymerase subunit RPC12/RpoP